MTDLDIINMTDKRLVALDVFRGMTISLMILVNTPGSWAHVYPYLLHAKWDGVMPADLVFPFFLFIIGVSMAFSFFNYKTGSKSVLRKKIIKRVLIIFLIGLCLNYFPFFNKSIDNLRIMGVLQRIALAYGLAAFICINVVSQHLWKVGVLMLIAYWAITFLLGTDVPFSLEGNFTAVVDKFFLGTNHIYKGFGIPFDPEGLLGTIPASVSAIAGYVVGLKIKATSERSLLVKDLLLVGLLALTVGLLWDLVLPINKPLWSGSYVMFTSGVASICLAILIELIDIRGYHKWTKPFLIFGVNPMILFVFSIVLVKILIYVIRWESMGKITTGYGWLYQNIFVFLLPNNLELASLLFAVVTVVICWSLGLFLYKRNVIVKI